MPLDPIVVVDAYLAAWNEPDVTARGRLLEGALHDEAVFCGPTGTFRGRAAIAALIDGMRRRLPGASVARVGPVGEGGDVGVIRFRWQVRTSAGEILLEGVDEVETGGDGRLVAVRMRSVAPT